MLGGLYIPNQPHLGNVSSLGSTVPVRPEDWTAEEPHDELMIRAVFRVALEDRTTRRSIEATTVESEQRVRLLASGEPVVSGFDDAAAAEQAAGGLGLEPFAILPVLPNTLPPHGATIARIGFVVEGQPHHGSGWMYLVDPRNGEEIRIDRVILRASTPGLGMFLLDWKAGSRSLGDDTADPDRMLGAAEAVLDAGVATLVFRTDPSAAESQADIDTVLNMAVVFEGVPVHRAQTEADLSRSVSGGPGLVRGRLLESD